LFGAILAVAVAHRELTILAAAALCLLDLWYGGWRAPAVRTRWGLAFLLGAGFRGVVDAARPFGSMFGPGSIARADGVDLSSLNAINSQVCLDPSRWAARGSDLVLGHLPAMVGGHPGRLLDSSINSGMGAGNPGLPVWVGTLVLAAVAIGWREAHRQASAGPGASDGAPDEALPWFLCLTGAFSIAVYWLVACSAITQDTMRYDLLALLLPAGALLAGMRSPARTVRAGLVTATLLWTVVAADDYRALTAEAWSGRWPDARGTGTARLVDRQIEVLWGDPRLAYVVSFRAQERVVVAPVTVHRIDEYAARAGAVSAPFLGLVACPGEELASGMWLCPPPEPGSRLY
jgi:hypothetical protein